jgi:hypothetical protein
MDPRALRHPLVAAAGLVVVLAAAAAILLAAAPHARTSRGGALTELRIHRRSPSGGPAVATVPDVRGRLLAGAEAALRASRFRTRIVRSSDPARPPDVVLSERPSPGTLVAPEVTIVLVVNQPRGVPPVTGGGQTSGG